MKPPPFAYSRASTMDEALALLHEAGDEAKLLAGGQSLIPLMAYRLARPSHLIDITAIEGLNGIHVTDQGLTIGPLVTHAQFERNDVLDGPWAAVRECAAQIGHYPIRVRGTSGGSLAHADPSAELPVVTTAFEAEFVVRSQHAERRIAASEFFAGPFMTALEPDEAIARIELPATSGRRHSAFEEFCTRSGDFASASAAVVLTLDDDACARQVRIALGSVGPVPVRASKAESALEGVPLDDHAIEEAGRLAAADCTPSGDAHASAAFRRELIAVLIGRALRRLREKS